MTDKQPKALRLAKVIDSREWSLEECDQAAALLRTQHAEIERLNSCLKWEQNRAERIGTHGPGCEKWGPAHYECLLRSVERKDALLRRMVDVWDEPERSLTACYGVVQAIKQELSQ